MRLKTKLSIPLFLVLMMSMPVPAFADLVCNVSATPAARAIVNGHWENTGDLTFSCSSLNATPTAEASITVSYGTPIVNSTTVPADHNISVAPGASYGVVLDTTRTDIGTTGVSQTASLVALTIPAQAVPANGTFTLRNVVLSLLGAAAVGQSVFAGVNVVSAGGNVTIAGGPVVVISQVLPKLSSTANPPALVAGTSPAQFTRAGANPVSDAGCSSDACLNARATFSVTVTENHIDAWRSAAQYYNNGNGVTTNGTNVLFTFSGMLPGSIVTNCAVVSSSGSAWNLTGNGIASAAGTTTYIAELVGVTDLTAIETLTLTCGTSQARPAYLAGVSTGSATIPITVSMSPFPIGLALPGIGSTPAITGGTPRYNSTGGSVGPVTVITFTNVAASQTTLTPAFSGLSCTVTAVPVARAVVSGHWENTGDMTFDCTVPNSAPTAEASITVYYSGLTIVNSTTLPSGHTITVTNTAGTLGAVLDTTRVDTGAAGVSNGGSLVAITIPAQAAPSAGTFVLKNVLLSLSGATVTGSSVSANTNVVSAFGNVTLAGAPVVIISQVLPQLSSTTNPPALAPGTSPAQFTLAGANPVSDAGCSSDACLNARATFSVTVTENHIDAWRSTAQYYNNGNGVATNGTNVLFTFSGMLPGSIVTNCAVVSSSGSAWNLTGNGIASAAGTTTYIAELVGVTDLTAIETLTLTCGTSQARPAYLAGVSTGSATVPITVSMSPFPIGSALPGAGGISAITGGTPRYNSTGGSVGPVTVITFTNTTASQTTLTPAFSGLSCTVTAVPVARAVANGHWENTGDMTFDCTVPNSAPTAEASITVYYSGLTIVNSTTLPSGHTITVTNTAGTLGAVLDTTRADTGAAGVSNGGSLVAITIPALAAPSAGTFVLKNVLLSLSGAAVTGSSVSANTNVVSAFGNVTLAGAPVVVISQVLPELSSTANPAALVAGTSPAQFTLAGANPVSDAGCSTDACLNARATFSVTVSENYIDAWRSVAQYYNNGNGVATNGTNVLFTFSGMLPGSIVTNCAMVSSSGSAWNLTGNGIASAAGTTTYVAELVGVTDLTAIETLTLSCGTSQARPAYLAGMSTGSATVPITVSMSPFPAGLALPGIGSTPAITGGTPRYNSTGGSVGPVTVIDFTNVAASQTTLTTPFSGLSCAVTAIPAARAIVNGHWENTGDLTFTCTATGATPTTEASITVSYGTVIANSPTLPSGHTISVLNSSGSMGVVLDVTRADTGATGVSNSGGLVALTIPAQALPADGTFVLRNVLLSLSGATVPGQFLAAGVNVVSASGNVTLVGAPVVVISAVLPELSSTMNPPVLVPPILGEAAAPAQFTGAGANPAADAGCSTNNCRNARAAFSVTVTEDHIDAWRTPAQYYNNGAGSGGNGTNVVYTFSGMLPGSIIANCVLIPPAGTVWNLTGSGIANASGTATIVAELVGGGMNLTAIETLTLICGTSTATPAYAVGGSTGLATTPITVAISTAPTGTALPGLGGTPAVTGGTPRYAATDGSVGPVTVIVFVTSESHRLRGQITSQ